MGAAETRLRHFPANSLPIRSNRRRLAPLSSNIGWAKPLRSHNQNPGHPIRDTLRSSSPETPRDGTPAFAGSPAAHDTIQCPAVLCAIPVRQPHPQSKKRPASPLPRRSLAVAMGTVYAPRPTHKAGDSGIRKDSGKVSAGFSCRTLFGGQSEKFPLFRLRKETIEI